MIPRSNIRNIGISAHIDSGKTTLSERILFYTGRIHKIEEVRGGGSGATMDFMELECEKGITITSAATTCTWHDTQINLIDTPGHVDFTIEVERSLRVLDGAIMVLCAVAGVQSQSITVDRQMKRYRIPRIAFINKMDRVGANPFRVVQALRDKLNLNPLLLQYPIGSEDKFEGVIDLIEMTANYFAGEKGEQHLILPIPENLRDKAEEAREKLLDRLSMFSDTIMEKLLEGKAVPKELIWEIIRKATLSLQLTPVLMGSAFKNKGVQNLLDAIALYLPSPIDREIVKAIDVQTNESVNVDSNPDNPLVALAFKITDEETGQLTYTRLYSGTLGKGDSYHNVDSSELAFRYAAKQGVLEGFAQAKPVILEPIMLVDVETPNEYVGRVQGDLSSRRGLLLGSQTMEGYSVISAEVPLKEMFGYSMAVRSLSSGQANFTMEFATYRQIPASQQAQLVAMMS